MYPLTLHLKGGHHDCIHPQHCLWPMLHPPNSIRAHRTSSTSHSISHHAVNTLVSAMISDTTTKFEHYACPMTHPVTGELMSSYKKLMNDPQPRKHGRQHSEKILGVWPKGTTKRDRKGLIQCLSWHTMTSNTYLLIRWSHMQKLSLTTDHKKRTQTGL